MGVTTTYSDRFTSAGRPVNGQILRAISGGTFDIGVVTDPPLEDDATSFVALVPVPTGAKLGIAFIDFPDGDTGGSAALDMDLILRRVVDGTTTDTVLYNAGSAFQSAVKDFFFLDLTSVGEEDDGVPMIGMKIVTPADTAGTGDFKLCVLWR